MIRVLSIGDLERVSGVPRTTIHYYLRLGLLPRPQKTAASRSLYTDEHVEILREIAELKLKDLNATTVEAAERMIEGSADLRHRYMVYKSTADFLLMAVAVFDLFEARRPNRISAFHTPTEVYIGRAASYYAVASSLALFALSAKTKDTMAPLTRMARTAARPKRLARSPSAAVGRSGDRAVLSSSSRTGSWRPRPGKAASSSPTTNVTGRPECPPAGMPETWRCPGRGGEAPTRSDAPIVRSRSRA